jgi:exosome complex RNA-binding protein Csl4
MARPCPVCASLLERTQLGYRCPNCPYHEKRGDARESR